MARSDKEILEAALNIEDTKRRGWTTADVFCGNADINRLLEGGFIEKRNPSSNLGEGNFSPALYRLTAAGRSLAKNPEQQFFEISYDEVIAGLSHIVGYADIKHDLAFSISRHNLWHVLLEGPPASVKTVLLDAIQKMIPEPFCYTAFGSTTSARGLSDKLCQLRPQLVLFDEFGTVNEDVQKIMLQIMESHRIIETKHNLDRGFNLHCQVIATCNRTKGMKPENISRFDFHPVLQTYTRPEYIEVVIAMTKPEQCPVNVAVMIGEQAFDLELGDVRQARGIWRQMHEPTESEVRRVLEMKLKYRPVEFVKAKMKVKTEPML